MSGAHRGTARATARKPLTRASVDALVRDLVNLETSPRRKRTCLIGNEFDFPKGNHYNLGWGAAHLEVRGRAAAGMYA